MQVHAADAVAEEAAVVVAVAAADLAPAGTAGDAALEDELRAGAALVVQADAEVGARGGGAETPSQRQVRRSPLLGGGSSSSRSEPRPFVYAGPMQVVAGTASPTQTPAEQMSTGVHSRPSSHAAPSAASVPPHAPAAQTSPTVQELPSSQAMPSLAGSLQSTPRLVAVTW